MNTMNTLEDRKKVDDIKNGVTDPDRINKFKNHIETCSELDLYMAIDTLGYILWRTEHDLADGRIEYPEWDQKDKYYVQAEIELAVGKTTRFGVNPFVGETTQPTPEYFKWYGQWKRYIDTLPKEEWEHLKGLMERGENCSEYRPKEPKEM